jgi:DivIVA domain-containing protein
MTTTQDQATGGDAERRLTPADLRNVRFTHGTRRNPGFDEAEVSRVLNRVGEELSRLIAEKAELRDQVHALREQLSGVQTPEPPSEQAVRILASAQQTADNYVAEAEEFSRQMTSDARAQYEERLREARENAGGIIQAAQEAAARMVAEGVPTGTPVGEGGATPEQVEEQVAYLKAFGQAVRVQLKSYLEALLADVEAEWGRADPAAIPALTGRPELPRPSAGGQAAGPKSSPNVAVEVAADKGAKGKPSDGKGAEVMGARR